MRGHVIVRRWSISFVIARLSRLTDTWEHNTNLSNIKSSTNQFPENCSQREKCKTQPINTRNSHLRKCCPIGESLSIAHDDQNRAMCVSTSRNVNIKVINVTLYDNCIEDMESELSLPLEIGNPCNTSFLYNDEEDLFLVVQDGSLLVMDPYANDTYSVEKKYCIDVENSSGTTYAIVCITAVEDHINRSQIVIVAILMLISIPCLVLVSYVHFRIKELKSVHGMTLSIMSGCLATGYFLYSLVHIFKLDERGFGYAVQFFILSYYFWFFCLCCNTSFNVWIHISLNKPKTQLITYLYMGSYCSVSFIGSSILVILTYQKGLPGMPSYFIQGYTESIRESQRYFIPPVSTLLLLSFFVMAGSFFGFQKLKRRGIPLASKQDVDISPLCNITVYEEVKKDAKCISLLGLILISTWLLEIVTFYSPGPQIYLILMDMVNGVQGVFVLLIFLIIRRRRRIIFRWWSDRGSLVLEKLELEAFN
ncbi:probable G-protein coupled receptor Mth-like 14 isoform X2 [Stomoxys calcitrans]|uniref:probable G-protein coupled receptor Mth-like 14 isoform X2 n=1 Tax=Stomoxys calcitrans TaxID=35570 RepID=UPI0027E3152D|nr:probable G-protein coupled receptor Mth-like 14 isoform X2 [Stomoxys calcitrans]